MFTWSSRLGVSNSCREIMDRYNLNGFFIVVILVLLGVITPDYSIVSGSNFCLSYQDCTQRFGNYRKCCNNKCVLRKYCDNYCNQAEDCEPEEKCADKKCFAPCNASVAECFKASYSYQSCCNNKCSYRRYCDNYCFVRHHCLPDEFCFNEQCTKLICDSWRHPCPTNKVCVDNACVWACDCPYDHKCADGVCEKSSSVITPSIIAGLVVAGVVFSLALIKYCHCRRRAQVRQRRQHRQQHQQHQHRQYPQQSQHRQRQQQQQEHIELTRQDHRPNIAPQITREPSSVPVLPNEPPSYQSLQRNAGIDESAPPTYEEAMRNYGKNPNVV